MFSLLLWVARVHIPVLHATPDEEFPVTPDITVLSVRLRRAAARPSVRRLAVSALAVATAVVTAW